MLRRALRTGLAASVAAAWCIVAVAAPDKPAVTIDYVGLDLGQHAPSTMLSPPPRDTGTRGAELAVADTNTTGRFTNQNFALRTMIEHDAAALRDDFGRALAAGQRIFVMDVPADLLVAMADMKGAERAVLLDATSADDRLRGADCRANTLHVLPSRAMLADALMQYLSVKNWRRILLLRGSDPADALYADAVRHAVDKFGVTLQDNRKWTFNPAAQQADTGHYQVNDEVAQATQGIDYDVLVVADEAGHFGDDLAYRTQLPRPVAGTQGLTPAAWGGAMDEYASTQLQARFFRLAGRAMTVRDYGGWLAVRSIGEAATRTGSTEPDRIITYLHGPSFAISGYKGPEFSFRAWDGQLRQPVLLMDDRSLVSISPQPGFLHENNELDTLGPDGPETSCRLH